MTSVSASPAIVGSAGRIAAIRDLGRQRYAETLATMRALHARVAAGVEGDTWLLVEHEPVVTLGRNAAASSQRLGDAALAERGIDLARVERGGDATYHGPGMLVVYPIVRLARFREIAGFVAALERATLETLATFGVTGSTRRDHRGVYAGERAIAAIGLAVREMTTLHGLALDVDGGCDYDRLIAPCGRGESVTSLAVECGRPVTLGEARRALVPALARAFDLTFVEALAA